MTESGLPRVVSIKKLFDEGLGIDETIRLRQGRITGATPEPGTSAAGPPSTVNDSPGLASTPISGIGPQPPTPDLPAGSGTPPKWVQLAFDDLDSAPVNGGTITEDTTPSTQTSGNGNNSSGGGDTPLTGNGASQPEDGVSLTLNYKPCWTPEQQALADQKVAALDEAACRGELSVSKVQGASGTAAGRLRQAGVDVPEGWHGHHMIDLQLGGQDLLSNLWPLDASVNSSLGAQIAAQIRALAVATCIASVSIC